jgi:Spx/MgsR family transcriptional regulator
MPVTLYGIKNCDTVRKARRWLSDQHIAFNFHDFRSDGLDIELLNQWIDELGWEVLLNKRSTTWRNVPQEIKKTIDQSSATTIMLENPTVIKRPILDIESKRIVGFSDATYRPILS